MSQARKESASADNMNRSRSLEGTRSDSDRSGDSSQSHRESLLLSDEQYIVDYLGNSSGSDDEMSIEAKRVTRRKKLEREKLQKLGKLIPLDTEIETEMISLAESNSAAYALPMRTKEELSDLSVLLSQDSRPSIACSSTPTTRRPSIVSRDLSRPRISKTVEFGVVKAAEFDKLPAENEQIIQIDSHMSIPDLLDSDESQITIISCASEDLPHSLKEEYKTMMDKNKN